LPAISLNCVLNRRAIGQSQYGGGAAFAYAVVRPEIESRRNLLCGFEEGKVKSD